MLGEQGDGVGKFLAEDERGRALPGYLAQLGEHLDAENQRLQSEAAAIAAHVGHIRTIVAAQQTYARRGGVTEAVDVAELLDNAVAIHFADMTDVSIRREYEPLAPLMLDRHKLIQILGNLLSNARHALKARAEGPRQLVLRVRRQGADSVAIEVQDSGVGIEQGVLRRLFEFGFTTKKEGHGFGLHTSAILAKELAGELVGVQRRAGAGRALRAAIEGGGGSAAKDGVIQVLTRLWLAETISCAIGSCFCR